jgi:phytol kinase
MDLVPIGVAGAGIVAALVLVETLSRWAKMRPETSRKLAHVSAGVIAAGLPLFMSVESIAVLAAAFIPIMLLSRHFWLLPSIHSAERATLGEAYFPLGVLLAALLFTRPLFFAFGVLVMAVSDAVAGVVGARYGRHRYPVLGGHKTYEGSAGFFIVTVPIAAAALVVGGAGIGEIVVVALGLAAVLTLVESAIGWGLDNTVLPVTGAFLMSLAVR